MAQTVATLEIADELVRIVTTLKTSLGLKVVSIGDLSQLPAPDLLDTWLDAVLIDPGKHEKDKESFQNYEVTHFFKIYYLRRCSDSEEITRKAITGLLTLERTLEENWNLPSCAWPTGISLTDFMLSKGDYDDPVNAFFAENDVPISALSLDLQVKTRSRR